MNHYNAHSHRPPVCPEEITLVNVIITPEDSFRFLPVVKHEYRSVGIHPWYVQDKKAQMELLFRYAGRPEVIAIGEAGLDTQTATPFDVQENLFVEQVLLAEEIKKPLIIHCVKAWHRLMAIRKRINPQMPWVVHGFRGNEVLAQQLIKQGMLLSFGQRCHPAALHKAWPHALLAETDLRHEDIQLVYCRLAFALDLSPDRLGAGIELNFRRTFGV